MRTNYSAILDQYLDPREAVVLTARGMRLCSNFKLTGTWPVGSAIGLKIAQKIQGGAWVPGVWALTHSNLYFISKRGFSAQGQIFDLRCPLTLLYDIEESRRLFGNHYELLYRGGKILMQMSRSEAAKLVPILRKGISILNERAS